FLTFTGKPRDEHVYEHAHESPWTMTVPLILLAALSVGVAWGPPDDPGHSELGHLLEHYGEPEAVHVDFKKAIADGKAGHATVGALALGVVGIGLAFAAVLYFYGVLDPQDAKDQFPGIHRFLQHKWYF